MWYQGYQGNAVTINTLFCVLQISSQAQSAVVTVCVCVSFSLQSALGLPAMSIPALASTGDEFHCHLSHPLASERCSQLLTALTGLQLQSLSPPEDVSSLFSSELFRSFEHWGHGVLLSELMGFIRMCSCHCRIDYTRYMTFVTILYNKIITILKLQVAHVMCPLLIFCRVFA